MNGRLNKVVMTGKIMRMKTGLYEKHGIQNGMTDKEELQTES